jgi:hypothetical protein
MGDGVMVTVDEKCNGNVEKGVTTGLTYVQGHFKI